jgi:hypothetical protein
VKLAKHGPTFAIERRALGEVADEGGRVELDAGRVGARASDHGNELVGELWRRRAVAELGGQSREKGGFEL